LREVLVAGGNHAAQAALLGFARERTDDVVGLHAFDLQQRPARGSYCVEERPDLRAEIVGHGGLGSPCIARTSRRGKSAPRVEDACKIVDLVVGKQLAQHVEHAVDRAGGLTRRVAQVGQRMEGAVQVRRPVNQQQRFSKGAYERQDSAAGEARRLFCIMSEHRAVILQTTNAQRF